MYLTNNTILITGGGSGIGLALAKELLNHGNKIIISGRNLEKLKWAKRQFPELEIIQCDISSEDSVTALVNEVEQKYPDLNGLINNAGIMGSWDIQKNDADIQGQKDEILTNIWGTIQLTQSLIRQLSNQKNSFILTVSSALAYAPFSAFPVYCATKAALHSYTISIREQLQNTSIKVFELLAPLVETEMVAHIKMSMPKMTTDQLATLTLNGLKKDNYEIRPGMANMLYLMSRFLPFVIKKSLAKESNKVLASV